MNAHDFVTAWRQEKDSLLVAFTGSDSTSLVAEQIRALHLSDVQIQQLTTVIDELLTDAFYTLLLGLDGSASIGGVQQTYRIFGEDGKLISTAGEIEAEAYEAFHG